MALGYTSLQWPESFPDLLGDLLRHEGELHDLLPRGALLIAAALPEMSPLPDETARELASRLLRAYSDREGLARFEEVRRSLEKAFGQLRGSGYERQAEEVLRSALSEAGSGGASLAPAAAALIDRLEWYAPRLVQALVDALSDDDPAWGFPVDRALRKAVTPPFPDPPSLPEMPREDPALAHYQRELERAHPGQDRQELRQRVARLEEKHRRAFDDYERRNAEFKELREAYDAAELLPPPCRIPTVDLPFRRALEDEPDLVDRIVQDTDWYRLTLALYGGMQDYRAPESIREYEQIAAYLGLSDNERTPFVSFYQQRWQGEDTIYDMAVYLDLREPRLRRNWGRQPRFSPEHIYQDSPLTPLLLSVLRKGRRAGTLIPELWKIWQNGGNPEVQAEALVGLLALGEEVRSIFQNPVQNVAEEVALRRLSRLSDALADPVVRASANVIPGLVHLAGKLEPRHWSAVVAAVIATAMSRGGLPIETDDLLRAAPESQKAFVLAEQLAQSIAGFGGDAVKDATMAAGGLISSSLPPELLVAALTRASEARHLDRATFHFGWSVEGLPPHTLGKDDIPLSALKNLEDIHPSICFLRTAVLRRCQPILRRNPALVPELLAISMSARGENEDREQTNRLLCSEVIGHPDPWSKVLRLAVAVKNPYHRARALLRLAECRPQHRETFVEQARSAISEIRAAHEREQVIERVIELSPVERRSGWVEEALRLVPEMEDSQDQVRALGRLTRYLPLHRGTELLDEALGRVQRLDDELAQAESLRVLTPLLLASPDLLERARALAGKMGSAWCRSLALDLKGALLLPLNSLLAGSSPENAHVWAPLVLSALLQDVEQLSGSRSPETLWIEFGENPGSQTSEALRRHSLTQGLILTRPPRRCWTISSPRGNGSRLWNPSCPFWSVRRRMPFQWWSRGSDIPILPLPATLRSASRRSRASPSGPPGGSWSFSRTNRISGAIARHG